MWSIQENVPCRLPGFEPWPCHIPSELGHILKPAASQFVHLEIGNDDDGDDDYNNGNIP